MMLVSAANFTTNLEIQSWIYKLSSGKERRRRTVVDKKSIVKNLVVKISDEKHEVSYCQIYFTPLVVKV